MTTYLHFFSSSFHAVRFIPLHHRNPMSPYPSMRPAQNIREKPQSKILYTFCVFDRGFIGICLLLRSE